MNSAMVCGHSKKRALETGPSFGAIVRCQAKTRKRLVILAPARFRNILFVLVLFVLKFIK